MDELSGMLQGGDAYITKPFQPPLLLAHIAAVLKRAKKADVLEKMICKGVELDVVRGCVKYREQQVEQWNRACHLEYHNDRRGTGDWTKSGSILCHDLCS